jgi:hypothetical protein
MFTTHVKSADSEVLDIGSRRELFVDHFLIDRLVTRWSAMAKAAGGTRLHYRSLQCLRLGSEPVLV